MVNPLLPWKSLNPRQLTWHGVAPENRYREKEIFIGSHVCFVSVYESLRNKCLLNMFFSQTSPVKHLWKLNGFSFRVICHHLNNHITTNLSNHQSQQWWRIFCLVGVFFPIEKIICKRYAPAKCLEPCSPPKNFRSHFFSNHQKQKQHLIYLWPQKMLRPLKI